MTAVLPAATDSRGLDGAEVARSRMDATKGSLLLGLAIALVNDNVPATKAVDELWAEAAGSGRALEGAYGRGVALANYYPQDATVQRALVLISKALRRGSRVVAVADEA